MNILITGGTGLVGKLLVERLKERRHDVRILTRKKSDDPKEFYWNIAEKEIDHKAFEKLDAIVHLAGATISQRWSEAYKKEMYSSRVDSANLLLDYCKKNHVHLKSFISASGVNYYGTFTSDQILKERDGVVQKDFLAELCVAWENAANKFTTISDKVVCLRTAMVLSKQGGAFPLLKKLVDFNLSSGVGSGQQWMNWIHVEDLVQMYIYAIENREIKGIYNAVADDVPTNKKFMKDLAEQSGKFFLPFNVPKFVLKAVLGEMSSIILEGTRADNKKIKSLGFDFKYGHLKDAFKSLI